MRNFVIAAVIAAATAAAAEPPAKIDLSKWSAERPYEGGWRAQRLLGGVVYGPDATEVGSVEDIVIGADGRIIGLEIGIGALLSIGGTHIGVPWGAHVSIPWDEARVSPSFDRATIPLTAEQAKAYPGARMGEGAWKASDLIKDYVTLGGRVGYGYVDDLVFDPLGHIQAIIVSREAAFGTEGPYAFPFDGAGFQPSLDYYDLPYGEAEVAAAPAVSDAPLH